MARAQIDQCLKAELKSRQSRRITENESESLEDDRVVPCWFVLRSFNAWFAATLIPRATMSATTNPPEPRTNDVSPPDLKEELEGRYVYIEQEK